MPQGKVQQAPPGRDGQGAGGHGCDELFLFLEVLGLGPLRLRLETDNAVLVRRQQALRLYQSPIFSEEGSHDRLALRSARVLCMIKAVEMLAQGAEIPPSNVRGFLLGVSNRTQSWPSSQNLRWRQTQEPARPWPAVAHRTCLSGQRGQAQRPAMTTEDSAGTER